uniref:KOW domain-containing protein n=1 Tax=Fagus sylvatica TaxID=28930 RepID=A0A2N9HYM7_FAGSY
MSGAKRLFKYGNPIAVRHTTVAPHHRRSVTGLVTIESAVPHRFNHPHHHRGLIESVTGTACHWPFRRRVVVRATSDGSCSTVELLWSGLRHLEFWTDQTYTSGFMDVVSIPKTTENFRLLYDTKGRFRLHSIRDEEAKFKLCKVRSVQFGQKGIPYLNTDDGRTIRYPDPKIKANDTIKLDLEINKITDFIKFDVGNVVMVTGGRNRVVLEVIKSREKHKGSFETVHIQDALGHEFATRLGNVFTVGKGHSTKEEKREY